jgi:hypothetical protein
VTGCGNLFQGFFDRNRQTAQVMFCTSSVTLREAVRAEPERLEHFVLKWNVKVERRNKKGLTISQKALNSMVAMGGIEPPTLGL